MCDEKYKLYDETLSQFKKYVTEYNYEIQYQKCKCSGRIPELASIEKQKFDVILKCAKNIFLRLPNPGNGIACSLFARKSEKLFLQ